MKSEDSSRVSSTSTSFLELNATGLLGDGPNDSGSAGLDRNPWSTLSRHTAEHGVAILPVRQTGSRSDSAPGQNFGPGQTHCTVANNVSPDETTVSLFAATGDHSFEQRLRQTAKLGFNKLSHFEIFPTLLVAMGYDENWVKRAYGQRLLDGLTDGPRSFMVGNPYLNPEMINAGPDETRQTRSR